jgi:hypothetical protein
MPFFWFCYEEGDGNNVVTFLYGGGVVEKVIFFLVVFSFLCFFFFLWCFSFSSLELTIDNEMVVLFFVEGWNG